LSRWYQAAAYQPFFRAHADFDTKRREPYVFQNTTMYIIRAAIRERFALLPFWYTMFYEHERFGLPVMRPLLSEFPLDKYAFKIEDQYMLSDKLMIRPVMEKGASKLMVYFPSTDADNKNGDRWFDFQYYDEIRNFLGQTPLGVNTFDVGPSRNMVFQRGGSIIPKKENVEKSSAYMKDGPITLIAALDENHKATGTLFIDDEKSFEYRNGKYLYLKFDYNFETITSKFIDKSANYSAGNLLERIVVTGAPYIPTYATINTTDGQSRVLEIFSNWNSRYFIIIGIDASLSDEWIITVSGAIRNLIAANLIIAVAAVNLSKFIF
jgi:mannosyl-oligosaccharide alpha-1,3-glucosidase